jgi:hypothetical protein
VVWNSPAFQQGLLSSYLPNAKPFLRHILTSYKRKTIGFLKSCRKFWQTLVVGHSLTNFGKEISHTRLHSGNHPVAVEKMAHRASSLKKHDKPAYLFHPSRANIFLLQPFNNRIAPNKHESKRRRKPS